MADESHRLPHSSDLDGPQRPPTFVQIQPPARQTNTRWSFGILAGALALVTGLGWVGYRVTGKLEPPVGPQETQAVTGTPAPQQAPLQPDDKLACGSIDTAVSSPAWTREFPMDWLSPFDPSVSDRAPPLVPPNDTAPAPQGAPTEISLRLGKGDTIGSALQKLGVASDTIAAVSSALAAHISLKSLPTGLAITVQIGPSSEDGTKPLLQALTLHPEGRRTVERNGKGNYAVERSRSSGR